jgi:hypothetical protein
MGTLLQIIGKGADEQVAAETHRRSRAMQLAPDKPQLLCRPIEQPGDFGFDLDQARLSCSVVPIATSIANGRRPARVLASRRIVDCGLHALAGSAIR